MDRLSLQVGILSGFFHGYTVLRFSFAYINFIVVVIVFFLVLFC
jgi:hypothetical protein